MKKSEEIINALTKKGYTGVSAEFESISYLSSGREGGWDVTVESEFEDFPDWTLVKLPQDMVADVMEGSILAYNSVDVLTIIGLLPEYVKKEVMKNNEIEELWGEDLYKVFANHINEEGCLTCDWADIIENEVPKWDSNYNDNPLFKETYSRMYNTDFEESEDGKSIKPIKY